MIANTGLLFTCGFVSLVCGLTGGLIGARITSQPPAKSLTLRELRLIDDRGQTRASLAMNSKGKPTFSLFDKSEKPVEELGVREDGPYLHLAGKDAWSEADLSFYNGKPSLAFSGDGREGRVIVGYVTDDDSIPSTMGHWGMLVGGFNNLNLALGIAIVNGKEYDAFAALPAKHDRKLPDRNLLQAPLTTE